jgi:plastocyanin
MTTQWKPMLGGLLALAALIAATACGEGDDPTATASPTESATSGASISPEFCSALVSFDALDSPGGEETPEEYSAAIEQYADEIEKPLASMTAATPDELTAAFETLNGLLPALHEGDIAAYEGPEGSAAIEQVEQVAADGCGFETVTVTAKDYLFTPDQTTIEAGPVSFHLTNQGAEPHVFLLLRKPDGDAREDATIVGDFLEKASSGDPAQMGEVLDEIVPGGGPFAQPGSEGSHILDLSAGTYVYWCPIPQGESGEGPPHFTLGMIGELTVE